MIYIACEKNDVSIVFNEWGWEVVDHFTGEWVSLAKEGDGSVLMEHVDKIDELGMEIFEGDLVVTSSGLLHSDKPYEVRWTKEYACFAFWQNGSFVKMLNKIDLRLMNIYEIQIVGNIYENPELCK